MKVFICTSGEYSEYHIDAVFTDEKQAKLFCAAHSDDFYSPIIEEWETDEVKLDTTLELCEKWVANFDSEGYRKNILKLGYAFKCPNSVSESHWRRTEYFVYVYLPEGTPEEKAKKIVCDYFAKWKYEKMEVM